MRTAYCASMFLLIDPLQLLDSLNIIGLTYPHTEHQNCSTSYLLASMLYSGPFPSE